MDFRRVFQTDRAESRLRRKQAIVDDTTWRYRTSPMVYGFRSDSDGGKYYQLVEVDGRLVRQPITGIVDNQLIDCSSTVFIPPPNMKAPVRVTYVGPVGEVIIFPESVRAWIVFGGAILKPIDGPLRDLLMFDVGMAEIPARLPPTLERLMIASWLPTFQTVISNWKQLTRLTHLVLPPCSPSPIGLAAPDLEELSIGIDRLPKEVWPTLHRLRALELRGWVNRLDLSDLPPSIEFLRLEIKTAGHWKLARWNRVDLRHLTRLRRVEIDVDLYQGWGDVVFDWPPSVTNLHLFRHCTLPMSSIEIDARWLPPNLKRLILGDFEVDFNTLPATLERIDLGRRVMTREITVSNIVTLIESIGTFCTLGGLIDRVTRGSSLLRWMAWGVAYGAGVGSWLYLIDRWRMWRGHRILTRFGREGHSTEVGRVTVPSEEVAKTCPPEWKVTVCAED